MIDLSPYSEFQQDLQHSLKQIQVYFTSEAFSLPRFAPSECLAHVNREEPGDYLKNGCTDIDSVRLVTPFLRDPGVFALCGHAFIKKRR
ncbi:hypothetical protein OOT46_10065 [Aquabacterium sp. A7-Y]|uniref:hypothetical protein n=1 Tax=Aquabacterium sp. A7-Y TaxID=1349605 RepID=UPI00223E5CA0|nr:hypothetical protein [Aquabacterium sp. A7-Y]MCW7538192.1 hypothetical protein [Aquabacterium sp. A7-Y]